MKKKKILIVDDEACIRNLFTTALTIKGYTVFSAESGEKALELLEQESIRVMFLDLNLPGINGVDLCRKIIKKTPEAVAYAVTGFSPVGKDKEYEAAGFTNFFSKPLPLDKLYAAAENAFIN